MEKQTDEKQSLWAGWSSPPNLVTFSRIILVVVFLGLYIAAGPWGLRNVGMRWAAAIIFFIAASTDKLDGWLARKYNQVTELGKLMDPIADKLLTLGALVVAACYGELGNAWVGWIVTGLFLLREIGITVMRIFVLDHGGKVIAASQIGKYKTLTQCLGIGLLMFPVWTFRRHLHADLLLAHPVPVFRLAICAWRHGRKEARGPVVGRRAAFCIPRA